MTAIMLSTAFAVAPNLFFIFYESVWTIFDMVFAASNNNHGLNTGINSSSLPVEQFPKVTQSTFILFLENCFNSFEQF